MSVKRGAEAAIYRKYLPHLEKFLDTKAVHEVDGDGKFWCKKEEWVEFLFPFISDDDGNAIAHSHCRISNTKTATEMLRSIRSGKKYICHRVYNMGFIKDLEKKKYGCNVKYFRRLKKGEVPTAVAICGRGPGLLERIFVSEGRKTRHGNFILSLNQACESFLQKLDSCKFDDEHARMKEWQKSIATLIRRGQIIRREDRYKYHPKSQD